MSKVCRTSVWMMVAMACVLVVYPGCKGLHTKKVVYSYSGQTGPAHWGDLKDDWAVCGTGTQQSPVDIVGATENSDLPALQVSYKATPAKLLHNGHTWEVEYEPGSTLTYAGKTYELLQFHFHTPSEHTVGGHQYAGEVHFVHRSDDGTLAVIGVLYKPGKENAFLKKFWSDFPKKKGEAHKHYHINAADGLPADKGYYTYQGSLTTPPCSEIVTWIVMDEVQEASQAQIDAMNDVFGDNARPVQCLHGRAIEQKP